MSDWLVDNPLFYDNAIFFIHYFGYITKIVVVLFIIGFFTNNPDSFLAINFFIKVLFSIFLIYRFNNYRKNKIQFTDLDRKICYSAGIYIFMFSFIDVIQSYVERLRELIDPYTVPILNNMKHLVGLNST
uniref:Uncharacterized protein n=1 Tax=viral metagenome TaxID=1070528 RepID=A0A6C0JW80_9ZZZZ